MQLIPKEVSSSHTCFLLVTAIRNLIERRWLVEVGQVFREANSCADCLAKHGHRCFASIHVYQSLSAFLSLAMLVDLFGHCSPHFILR